MKVRIKSRGTVVLLAGGLVMAVWWLGSSRTPDPHSALALSPLVLTNNQFQITITNVSSRIIHHDIAAAHFKKHEEWEAPFISLYTLTNGQTVVWATLQPTNERLLPGSVHIRSGEVPRTINAPFEATAWRVAVVWSYESQTTWEKCWYQLHTRMHGQPPYPLPMLYTNYSSEIKIGSGRLPKHLYP